MKPGFLALAISIATGIAPAIASFQTSDAPAPAAAEALREAQNTLRALNRISDALEREPLEPVDLVKKVSPSGGDARELTRWVAEKVGWLPYRGALRGPRGVLIERAGNSLDQSLLLAEALRVTGLEVRLAHAVLPLETAEGLYEGLRSPRAAELEEDDKPADGALARFAESIGADPALLRTEVEAQEIQVQEHLERVLPMVVGQARALKQLLEQQGVSGTAADAESLELSETEILRDHWWVQVSEDGEQWSDRDPVAMRAGVELELDPARTCSPEDLPEAERHRLTVRVVVERLGASGLETETALTHAADASSLAGGYFLLGFRPMNPERIAGLAEAGKEPGEVLLALATKETEWLPTLLEVDYLGRSTEHHESSVFTDGTLNEKPQLETKSRKLGDAIGALGGAAEKGTSGSRLTAAWMEYVIETPGAGSRTVRRALFDLLGEARRRSGADGFPELSAHQVAVRGLAMTGRTDILPSTCRLSSDFTLRFNLATYLRNQRLLVDAARIEAEGGPPDPELASSLSTPPVELYALAQERLVVGRHAHRVHLGALNVLSSHFWPFEPEPDLAARLSVDGVAPKLAFSKAIDIVANGVAVLAPAPGEEDPASAWDIRLEQGVLDTVVEAFVLMEPEDVLDGGVSGEHGLATNTATWMERHPVDQWRVMRPGDELDASAGDTHARAASALAAGQAVVLHGSTLADSSEGAWKPGCWWRVDVETGETLGIGPRGWGQAGEDVVVRSNAQKWLYAVKYMGREFVCFFLAVTARVHVGVLVSGLGEVFGASEYVRYAMAALSQVGYTGAVYRFLENACRVLIMGI